MPNTVDQFVDRLSEEIAANRLQLPTLPEVGLRVKDKVEDPDASAHDVASIIVSDPALSARLISVVNSPLYRARDPINDVQMAVSRIGLTVVRSIVISLVMKQIFQPTVSALDDKLRRLWEHSTQVAAISHTLAKQYTRLRPDEAMLAGLIHDIGALPILMEAEHHPEILEDETALDAAIQAKHGEIGKLILETWEFPAHMIVAVSEHEDLQRQGGDKPDYVDIVQVANIQSYFGTQHPLGQLDWSTVAAFARLGIDTGVEEISLDQMPEDLTEAQAVLAG